MEYSHRLLRRKSFDSKFASSLFHLFLSSSISRLIPAHFFIFFLRLFIWRTRCLCFHLFLFLYFILSLYLSISIFLSLSIALSPSSFSVSHFVCSLLPALRLNPSLAPPPPTFLPLSPPLRFLLPLSVSF